MFRREETKHVGCYSGVTFAVVGGLVEIANVLIHDIVLVYAKWYQVMVESLAWIPCLAFLAREVEANTQ